MYLEIAARLRDALAKHIRAKYGVELPIVLERPPKIEFGEAASPVCFELAKRLKKAPRQIAQEIQNALPVVPGIAKLEVAGAGYLNAYFDRGVFWDAARSEAKAAIPKKDSQDWLSHKIIVEHTSINPNKAAHIRHVRNAVRWRWSHASIITAGICMPKLRNFLRRTKSGPRNCAGRR